MKKAICIILCLVGLSGCTSATDSMAKWAGLGNVTESKSTFDGATTVDMSPNLLYEKGAFMANKIQLGARWSSQAPTEVALVLAHASSTSSPGVGTAFANISGLDINIDGKVQSFETSGRTMHTGSDYDSFQRTIHTKSSNAVFVPLATLQGMMDAQDCRLRIRTSNGFEDSNFSLDRVGNGAATARLTLREFITKIEAAKDANNLK